MDTMQELKDLLELTSIACELEIDELNNKPTDLKVCMCYAHIIKRGLNELDRLISII